MKRKSHACRLAFALVVLAVQGLSTAADVESQPKPRLFVLTDMGADPDDTQSLVRLLLYANEIDIEGIAATTSMPQKTRVTPELVHEVLRAYGVVQGQLAVHDPAFPRAGLLAQRVVAGPALYGMAGVGADQGSPASRALVSALESSDPRPLWVSVWGGPNVLAQALWSIRARHAAGEAEKLYAKLRVYAISDQDDSGPWIRKSFPSVFYIVTPGSWGRATWRAMASAQAGSDAEVVSPAWLARHIQQGHGALGAMYPDIAYGMEGDTPSWLGLIPNGLSDPERPDWGGWGGRYELATPPLLPADPRMPPGAELRIPETRPIWTNAQDSYPPPTAPSPFAHASHATAVARVRDNFVTLWRWRTAVQNDFAARMTWAHSRFEDANHPPVVRLAGPRDIQVRSGGSFDLDASPSSDPDGDSLSFRWYQYPEAGSYRKTIGLGGRSQNLRTIHGINAPEVSKPETAHFILEVTDKGTPPLTRYQRVIVHISP